MISTYTNDNSLRIFSMTLRFKSALLVASKMDNQGWQFPGKYLYFPPGREILGNTGKYWEILGNTGKYWEIPGNTWEIPGKYLETYP